MLIFLPFSLHPFLPSYPTLLGSHGLHIRKDQIRKIPLSLNDEFVIIAFRI